MHTSRLMKVIEKVRYWGGHQGHTWHTSLPPTLPLNTQFSHLLVLRIHPVVLQLSLSNKHPYSKKKRAPLMNYRIEVSKNILEAFEGKIKLGGEESLVVFAFSCYSKDLRKLSAQLV